MDPRAVPRRTQDMIQDDPPASDVSIRSCDAETAADETYCKLEQGILPEIPRRQHWSPSSRRSGRLRRCTRRAYPSNEAMRAASLDDDSDDVRELGDTVLVDAPPPGATSTCRTTTPHAWTSARTLGFTGTDAPARASRSQKPRAAKPSGQSRKSRGPTMMDRIAAGWSARSSKPVTSSPPSSAFAGFAAPGSSSGLVGRCGACLSNIAASTCVVAPTRSPHRAPLRTLELPHRQPPA